MWTLRFGATSSRRTCEHRSRIGKSDANHAPLVRFVTARPVKMRDNRGVRGGTMIVPFWTLLPAFARKRPKRRFQKTDACLLGFRRFEGNARPLRIPKGPTPDAAENKRTGRYVQSSALSESIARFRACAVSGFFFAPFPPRPGLRRAARNSVSIQNSKSKIQNRMAGGIMRETGINTKTIGTEN